jgi:hypothetical protein
MERVERVPATPRSSSTKIVGAAALAFLLAGALTAPASALAPTALRAPSSQVSTSPAGAHVRLSRGGTWIEVRGPRGGGGNGDDGGGGGGTPFGCRRRWVPTQYPNYLRTSPVSPDFHVTPMPPRPGPGYVAYHVFCGTDYITSVWLPPDAFAAAAPVVDVRAIAEQLVRDLPYPAATIQISPDARGLTGLESWFWVNGYTGVLRDAVEELGIRVEVEALPASVRWDFGDGTPTSAGTLGRATPARSDVVHRYERRSRTTPLAVRATVRLDVRYRVGNGPWQALDPVFRTAARGYPVAESRAALVPSS